MEGPLHLNEIHCDLVSEYLKFFKYQLGQRLKSIDYCFTSLINCRVRSNETYTGDEVKMLLQDLQDVVRGEVDTELTDGVHTNTLFVQQLLSQAEEWHLTLSANVSELENREKLNAVKLFDEQQRNSDNQKMSITVTKMKQIIPVEDMNVASALKREIAKLTTDKDFMQEKIIKLEQQISNTNSNTIEDRSDTITKLESDLAAAHEEICKLRTQLSSLDRSDSIEKLQIVQDAVDTLSKELESSKAQAEEQTEKLKKDLEAREDKLRHIQTNLLLAEKELDKKFQATQAYTNMKKILMQKNNKIKTLRKKLVALGGTDCDDEGEKKEDNNSDEGQEGFDI